MNKTVKKKNININNKTKKKNIQIQTICPANLKPFMKNLDKHTKQKKIEINKKTFVKHLLNEIANDKYKPQDDFYDYTNYLWLKYIVPNKLEKYIIKLNDFTLMPTR